MSAENGRPAADVADMSPSSSAPGPEPAATPSDSDFSLVRLLESQYLLVIVSALAIIWLGAHGSLRRPPSAAPAKLKKGEKRPKEPKFVEGLVASDAITFPVLLGAVLIGLYYLIQWLQDPAILNKLLRGYMSVMSVAGLATLAGDSLNLLASLVFPDIWADRAGRVYHVDPDRRCQYVVDRETGEETAVRGKETPLPGPLSDLPLSPASTRFLWRLRHLLNEEWRLRLAVHGTTLLEHDVRLTDLLRFAIAGAVAVAYHLTAWHAVSNLLSVAMCYAAFMMFSPTSFVIGTMVLAGLFVYDIVMVFYTPYMVTVAKKIDAPIKLVFTGSKGASMLGLGDIVVPGMLMALALRFDLYQYYQKQIKLEPVELKTELGVPSSPSAAKTTKTKTTTTTTTTTTQYRRVKAPYVDPRGQWANRLWTFFAGRGSGAQGEGARPSRSAALAATAFPKPYFHASLAGYAAGMLATLAALLLSGGRGQPALLYLVPGVTGALWLAGLARGELGDMWRYTEDGSLDTEDVVVEVAVEVDGRRRTSTSRAVEVGGEGEAKGKESEEAGAGSDGGGGGKGEGVKAEGGGEDGKGRRELFVLSITAPGSAAAW